VTWGRGRESIFNRLTWENCSVDGILVQEIFLPCCIFASRFSFVTTSPLHADRFKKERTIRRNVGRQAG
jgi:hypothetical protein